MLNSLVAKISVLVKFYLFVMNEPSDIIESILIFKNYFDIFLIYNNSYDLDSLPLFFNLQFIQCSLSSAISA